MMRGYFVLIFNNIEADSSTSLWNIASFYQKVHIYTEVDCGFTFPRCAADSKGGNAFEITLLHCGAL